MFKPSSTFPLNSRVAVNVAMTGRVIGRTYEASPRYDIETPQGVVCGIPGDWLALDLPETVTPLRKAS
jgi:hypothetical protein